MPYIDSFQSSSNQISSGSKDQMSDPIALPTRDGASPTLIFLPMERQPKWTSSSFLVATSGPSPWGGCTELNGVNEIEWAFPRFVITTRVVLSNTHYRKHFYLAITSNIYCLKLLKLSKRKIDEVFLNRFHRRIDRHCRISRYRSG